MRQTDAYRQARIQDCLDDLALLGAGHDAAWALDFPIMAELNPQTAIYNVARLPWYPTLSYGARINLWGALLASVELSRETQHATHYWLEDVLGSEAIALVFAVAEGRTLAPKRASITRDAGNSPAARK